MTDPVLQNDRMDIQSVSIREQTLTLEPLGRRNADLISGRQFDDISSAALVLADVIADENLQGKRILELGAGLGLPSMIAKQRGGDITASDTNRLFEEILKRNTERNHIDAIPFIQLDWQTGDLNFEDFDLIIGSDLLYTPEQPRLLASIVAKICPRGGELILTDPGRLQMGKFNKRIKKFGFKLEVIETGKMVRYFRT